MICQPASSRTDVEMPTMIFADFAHGVALEFSVSAALPYMYLRGPRIVLNDLKRDIG